MTDHAEYRDRIAAYALGSLEPVEAAEMERHLDECAECRRELREHREVLVEMAAALPEEQPRPALRAEVLRRARKARPPAAVAIDTNARTTPSRAGRSAPTPTGSGTGSAAGWLAAAAMALVAVLAGWAWLQADRARDAAVLRADELVAELEQERTRAAAAEDLAATLLAPDVTTANLSSTDQAPSLRLFWNRGSNTMVVAAFDLPAPPEGRTYQLWGIDTAAGTAPVGLGTFDTAADGRAVATFVLPAGVAFDLAAVTEEPDGGSPAPTTTPFLAGPVPSAD